MVIFFSLFYTTVKALVELSCELDGPFIETYHELEIQLTLMEKNI